MLASGIFLTGFRPDPDKKSFWGTPVGLISDKAGYLYLSSDRFTQAIFRIEASPLQGLWQNPPPDSLKINGNLHIDSIIQIIRQEHSHGPITVTADLSEFNGPSKMRLEPENDDRFRFHTSAPVGPTEWNKNN